MDAHPKRRSTATALPPVRWVPIGWLPVILATILCSPAGFADEAAPTHGIGERVAPLYHRDSEPISAASCAASGCHGGPRPGVADPASGGLSAYPLWLERDPHARAWDSLCKPAGVAMMNRLGILVDGQIADLDGFNNCLACHNTHQADSSDLGSAPRQPEGVGCVACHGPAQHWIHEHYSAAWNPSAATRTGFVQNADLVTRARMCASCHVGDQDRDMNHDLIAAGAAPPRGGVTAIRVSDFPERPVHDRQRHPADRPRADRTPSFSLRAMRRAAALHARPEAADLPILRP
jgi:hypothetical protein